MTYFLYGPPGSGKTTTGRILAKRLNLPFWDLDAETEAQAGMSLPHIFDRGGEGRLRDQERLALDDVLTRGPGVIALGGGALLDPESLARVQCAGRILCLTASEDTLARRLGGQEIDRPLLRGNGGERLHQVLATRETHYRSFPRQLSTEGSDPEQSAWEAQLRLGVFHIRGMGRGCDVRVQSGGIRSLGNVIREMGLRGPVVVVTDRNVGPRYALECVAGLRSSGFRAGHITLPSGEASKVLAQVVRLWQSFQELGVDRESTVVGLGGGVVGDLAGFAAATFLRGVPWVSAPTSLLAMVDASLGGKTAINLGKGKNLIGAFHGPQLVMTDPDTLRTLPDAEWRSGMAEVVKHGVVGDPTLLEMASAGLDHFKLRTEDVIPRAMAVKVSVVEADPYERDVRATLNFGHTVGHGLEVASHFRLRHGEAVAIGMAAEARLAERIGLASGGLATPLAEILSASGLPTEIPHSIDRHAVVRAMTLDKKRKDGQVRFALPVAFGRVLPSVEAEGWADWIMTL